MAFPAKKPAVNIAVLGIGRNKPPEEGPPPAFGAPKATAAPTPDPMAEEGPSDSGVTADMLEYHGPAPCSDCSHFTAPTTCDRFSDQVEEGGHCNGFESASGPADEMGAADVGAGAEPSMGQ